MKHRFVSKRYWKDQQTPMGKVDELAKNYNDVINLSLGDPDLTTHELIIRKSFEDASAGHTKYTDFRGDPELRAEICKYYKDMFDMTVKDEEVFVSASGCLAMYLALEAILDDGDEVILQAPFFTPYPQQVELARGIPVELPTYEEEDFQINIERLESLITERTKALVINTPSNPTGNCLTVDTMEKHAIGGRDYADKCFICHSNCPETAEQTRAAVSERFPNIKGDVRICDIGTIIAGHCGPGTVAVFFYGDARAAREK